MQEETLAFNEIDSDIKKIINEVTNVPVQIIENSTDLREHLGIDSFAATEILVTIEQKYKITLDPAEIFNLRTFADIAELTQRYLRG